MLDTPRRADPDDCEGAPDSDTPIVQELQATVSAAEQAAEPYTQAITILEGQMGGLRAAPRPDRAMLELLGTGRTQYAMHPDEAAGGRPP